jgi:hypothetical protein
VELADRYREEAKFGVVNFDSGMQRVLIAGGHDVCARRNWRLHAVGTDATHAHYLISRSGYFEFVEVRDKLKNLLSLFLGRYTGINGRQWFAAGGSNQRVKDQAHLDRLVTSYLPDHRGVYWEEGMEVPEIREGIL